MKRLTLLAFLLAGCASLQPADPGRIYTDHAFQAVAKTWDPEVLREYASSEFYVLCPPYKAQRICEFLQKNLGTMKSMPPMKPAATQPSPDGNERRLEIYEGSAEFEKGPGNVTVVVSNKDGRWGIENFQVASPVLMNVPPPSFDLSTPAPTPTPAPVGTPTADLTPAAPEVPGNVTVPTATPTL